MGWPLEVTVDAVIGLTTTGLSAAKPGDVANSINVASQAHFIDSSHSKPPRESALSASRKCRRQIYPTSLPRLAQNDYKWSEGAPGDDGRRTKRWDRRGCRLDELRPPDHWDCKIW